MSQATDEIIEALLFCSGEHVRQDIIETAVIECLSGFNHELQKLDEVFPVLKPDQANDQKKIVPGFPAVQFVEQGSEMFETCRVFSRPPVQTISRIGQDVDHQFEHWTLQIECPVRVRSDSH